MRDYIYARPYDDELPSEEEDMKNESIDHWEAVMWEDEDDEEILKIKAGEPIVEDIPEKTDGD